MKKVDEMSNEELTNLLKEIKKRKTYGLVWEDKPEDVAEQCKKELPVLDEVNERAIIKDKNKPVNLLIEGDNYHALSVLNYTHYGRIDVIYIDPPYNTGQQDFKYNDKWIDKDDNYRHSKWLSFMQKRLELAKNILKDDGVILISIDVNELAQLKLLADKIFLENNLISLISVKVKDPAGVGQQSFIFDVSEYVLVYAKNINTFKSKHKQLPVDFEVIKEQTGYNKILLDFGKPKFIKEITRQNVGQVKIYSCVDFDVKRTSNLTFNDYIKNRSKIFADYNPNGGMILAIKDEIPQKGLSYIEYRPTKGRDLGGLAKIYFLNGRIISWLSNVTHYEGGKLYKRTKMTNIWDMPNASLYLEGGVDFANGKKPLRLIKKLLSMFQAENTIVLDFFAGSGTTAEAVLMLNEEDDKNRSFILSTNNENNIAENITFKRLKNVINGYGNKNKISANLRYFKTNFVSKSKVSDDTRRELVKRSTEMICLRENTFDKLIDKAGFKVYKDFEHTTGILFDLDALNELKIKLQEQKLPAHIYVFSLTNDTFDADFEDLGLEHELCPIPESILEVYRKLFK